MTRGCCCWNQPNIFVGSFDGIIQMGHEPDPGLAHSPYTAAHQLDVMVEALGADDFIKEFPIKMLPVMQQQVRVLARPECKETFARIESREDLAVIVDTMRGIVEMCDTFPGRMLRAKKKFFSALGKGHKFKAYKDHRTKQAHDIVLGLSLLRASLCPLNLQSLGH